MVIDFWDTAGQERFNSMHPSYYHRAHVCVLVFDCTRKITYTNLANWYRELQTNRPGIPTVLVANKIDLAPQATSKAFAFAEKFKLPLHYVSASDGTNVVRLFQQAIQLGLQFKANPPDDFLSNVLQLLDEVDS
eukprot:gnl/Hemi2/7362_TR2506_c0_g1_i1.p1 gnl/Hemi2/7362_TR2506_c0_g1~~gnl/Hemi2/7362_TR2506_c0_g1_i1.p1  ORF type:complete len:134 (-),score=40.29 gnl/Hemi2/7362_TR2506_c0_g1_i1:16-417(-)